MKFFSELFGSGTFFSQINDVFHVSVSSFSYEYSQKWVGVFDQVQWCVILHNLPFFQNQYLVIVYEGVQSMGYCNDCGLNLIEYILQ